LPNYFADLHPPGRGGDISQFLGNASAPLHVTGHIDSAVTWHGGYGKDLEVLRQIRELHDYTYDPWYWFTWEGGAMKVTVRNLDLIWPSEGDPIVLYDLELKEYNGSNASYPYQNYYDRGWGVGP
jgi:hypothetical protein